MRRKGIALAAAVLLAAGLLTACSGTEQADSTGTEIKTDSSGGTSAEPDKDPGAAEPAETPDPTKDQTKEPTEAPEGKAESGTDGGDEGIRSLQEFCDDDEVDAWFAQIKDEPPAKLTYWIYGEGPFSMEFTDEDLIMEAADALQTVTIDGLSEENPDLVEDAGGIGYYFEMEDGTTMGFSFMMGTFQWNDSEYHDVASLGDLGEVNEKLEKIGNPQYLPVRAGDDGFYTEYLETYETQWVDEEGVTGGLFIWMDGPGEAPYIAIGRCVDETPDDPEGYLTGYLAPKMKESVKEDIDASFEAAGEVQEYEYGGKTFTGQMFTVTGTGEDGADETANMLILVLKTKDSLLNEDHLVRFYAVYDENDEEETAKVETALENAANEFSLKHMWFERGEVQPDNYLLDFMNDEGIRAWYDKALAQPPDELLVTTDTWHAVDDPELIRKTLEALATVRIGDVAEDVVGASGRQIYDFIDQETGNYVSFEFFENQFSYEMEDYIVLDWGDLNDLLPELEKS